MPGVFLLTAGPTWLDPQAQAVQSNTTLTSSGSAIFSAYGEKEVTLVVNVTATPTGTTPTLVYSIQEVDPGNQVTALGPSVTSSTINSIGIQTITLPATQGGTIKVSWTVNGTFSGVYATLNQRGAGRQIEGLGTAGSPVGQVISVQGVSGGQAVPVSGTIAATQSGTWTSTVTQVTAANLLATVTQGTSATLSGAWPVKVTDGINTFPTMDSVARKAYMAITDGTNGPVAVKAGSTSPGIGDQALVVVISPNQGAIPVTTSPVVSTPGIAQGYIITTAKTNVPVRATTYTEQSTNFTGSIVSSNANDASAGIGARTVTVTYVDQACATQATETVTLNGTTAVNLVNTGKCFIQSILVNTVGTNGANVGTITLFTGTGGTGTNVGSIAAGDKRTFWAHHFVVSGKTCHVTDFTGLNNSTTNQSLFILQAQSIPTANSPSIAIGDWITSAATFQVQRTFGSTVNIAGPASVVLFVQPSGVTNTQSQGSFTYYDS